MSKGIGEWKRNLQKLIDGSHSKWVMFEPTDFRRSLIAAQNSGSDVGVITSLPSVGSDWDKYREMASTVGEGCCHSDATHAVPTPPNEIVHHWN